MLNLRNYFQLFSLFLIAGVVLSWNGDELNTFVKSIVLHKNPVIENEYLLGNPK